MRYTAQDIRLGNKDAFRMVYQLYHQKLYYFTLRHVQSAYVAEETVQLTFIRMWERRESLSPEVSISQQLFRIAKSIMIDLLRKEYVRDRHMGVYSEGQERESPAFDLEGKEELERVYFYLEHLSPVRRHVFRMSRLEGWTYQQIAEALSISPRTVENHVLRAVSQLRKALL
ncbi:RNA polymerase sigma-70 factor [Chitinophaga rhizosphaerae]|uniref:RNA polymerase sigma-70 factor n=1 Tax=Chitinophaga rhizosphaerae TaxID=1864947 RepID=UPI000F8159E7|nr:RNA polymerase sigma-70 factor [Chitinophaga rhizosphaerae]